MKTKTFFAVLSVLGLLASCAQMSPHPMDMTLAIQDAKTSADHEALAKHYEDAAKEMRLKAQNHKKKLVQYKAKSHLYGKQAQPLQAHCRNLISFYDQAAEANMNMARNHHEMAQKK